jgi:hypothetical protein
MLDAIVLGIVDLAALVLFLQLGLAAWDRPSAWSVLRRFMASPIGRATRAAYRWVAPLLVLMCTIELLALLLALLKRPAAG